MDKIKTAMGNKYVIAGAAFAAGVLSGYILFGMKLANKNSEDASVT